MNNLTQMPTIECKPDSLAFLQPGGGFSGPLMAGMLELMRGERGIFATGERVGAFEIVKLLGCGGSSTVYLARRADVDFEQLVALKVFHVAHTPTLAFKNEWRILARMGHESIASFIDAGEDSQGRCWFAMQYIDGVRIDQFCNEKKLDFRARLRILVKVCSAVHYANQLGVIHGDIKPANVLVNTRGEPFLLDFGIASFVAANGLFENEIRANTKAFTPGFASPEQLKNELLSTATDVFQLGLLTKLLILSCKSTTAECSGLTCVTRHEVNQLVFCATKGNAKIRYSSVHALSKDLSAILERRPVTVIRHPLYRWSRHIARHAVSATVLVLSIIAIALSLVMSFNRVAKERDKAIVAEALAKKESLSRIESEQTAQQVRGYLISLLGSLNPVTHPEKSESSLTALINAENLVINSPMGDQYRVPIITTLAKIRLDTGQPSRARQLLDSLSVSKSMLEDPAVVAKRDIVAALVTQGETFAALSDFKAALERYEKAEYMLRSIDDRSLLALLHSNKALAYWYLGQLTESWRAVQTVQQLLAVDNDKSIIQENSAIALSQVSGIARERGELRLAIKMAGRAVSIFGVIGSGGTPNDILAHVRLGQAQMYIGEKAQAIHTLGKALELQHAMVPAGSLTEANIVNRLASMLLHTGDYERCISAALRSINMMHALNVTSHHTLASSHGFAAGAYFELKSYEKSKQHFKKALVLYKSLYGDSHFLFIEALRGLALAQVNSSEINGAKSNIDRALLLAESYNRDDPLGMAKTYLAASKVESRLGNNCEASIKLKQAIEEFNKVKRLSVQDEYELTKSKNFIGADKVLGCSAR